MRSISVITVIVVSLAILASLAASVTVETNSGPVTGYSPTSGVNAFLGIPYAAPPVGTLRWTAPAAPATWTDALNATEFGHTCVQNSTGLTLTPGPAQIFDEDCLTLNVWAPSSGSGFPVMVWIHGGFLISGGSAQTVFDGVDFATNGTILVSFNYRLGNLGFLALNELEGSANGAFGFLDQQFALAWVQNNIGFFGGDSNSVTIFGESAGAGCVALHVTTPSSWPYFQHAILESSPAFAETNFIDEQIVIGEALVSRLGCAYSDPSLVLVCMRAQSAVAFAITTSQTLPSIACGPSQVTNLTVYQAVQQGRIHPGAILAGDVNNEGSIFIAAVFPTKITPEAYELSMAAFLSATMGVSAADASAMTTQYPCASYDPTDCRYAASALYGDLRYRCPTNALLHAALNVTGVTAYAFMFMHVPSYGTAALGSYHGSELPYVFETIGALNYSATAAEIQLGVDMKTAWATFASSGVPGTTTQPTWPAYSSPSYSRVMIDTGTWTTGSSEACSFFTPYFQNLYTQVVTTPTPSATATATPTPSPSSGWSQHLPRPIAMVILPLLLLLI